MNEASHDPVFRSPQEIARSSLDHARDYLGNVRKAIQRAVDLFRDSRVDEATALYTHTLDALNVLVFVLGSAASHLGPAGDPLRLIDRESGPWIASLLEAQKLRDWTALADCLEYEVAPELERWQTRIDALERSAE